MVHKPFVDGLVKIITFIIKPFENINTTLGGFISGIIDGVHKKFVEPIYEKSIEGIQTLTQITKDVGSSINFEDIWKSPVDFYQAHIVAQKKWSDINSKTITAMGIGIPLELLNPFSQGSIPHFINTALTMGGAFTMAGKYWDTHIDRILTTPMRYALNYLYTPEYLSYIDLQHMRSRYIIGNSDFLEGLRFQGIDVSKKLITPTDWYDEASIIEHFDEPEKWKKTKINTWGDALIRQAGAPAGYFLLSMASRTGYFDEKIFQQALLDSDYGPLPMGIAMQAFRKAFLSRWLTKYEDGAIEEFLAGDIDEKEFHDRLVALEYTDDVANIFTSFFKNRREETRRKALLSTYKKAYQRGKISAEEFKRYLIGKGFDLDSIDLIISMTDEEIMDEKYLTKAEIIKLYRHDLITEDELKRRLYNIYADKEEAELIFKLEKKLKIGGEK